MVNKTTPATKRGGRAKVSGVGAFTRHNEVREAAVAGSQRRKQTLQVG
jgi:hypothetical protein